MNERWFYAKDRKKSGPVTREVILAMLARGDLLPTDMVLREGETRWAAASTLLPPAGPPREASPLADSIFAGPPRRGPAAGQAPSEAPPPGLPGRIGRGLLNALLEVPRAVGAALAQTGRLLGYWKTKRQTARLANGSRRAQVDLGEGVARSNLGDPALCKQLAAIDQRLPIIRESRGSVKESLVERDALLRQIAFPWLKSDAPPGLQAEHHRAVQATHSRTEQERTRERARAALFPTTAAGRARVGAGYALLAGVTCLAVLLTLPLLQPSQPGGDERAAGPSRSGNETPPVGTPVNTDKDRGDITAKVTGKAKEPDKTPEKEKQKEPPKEKQKEPPKEKQPEKEKKTDSPPKRSLKQLFAALSPAVPVVECLGAGGGSGFLVRHDGRLLVVTNRHVIEHARNGIEVHFVRSKSGKEELLKVTKDKAKLVAVHKTVDLAVIDVSADGAALAKWGIKPVALAPRDYEISVGENVFAIGHPGDAAGGVLRQTLSPGLVSAVRRQFKAVTGSFLQVTAPINPGNSGGPIFDDDGQVVAVATFIIRRARDKDIALEGLNFALDVRFVHEILTDPSYSLKPAEIADLIGGKLPGGAMPGGPLQTRMEAKLKILEKQGYRPLTGNLKSSVVPLRMRGNGAFLFTLKQLLPQDQVAIFVVSSGSTDVGLFVYDFGGQKIVENVPGNSEPVVAFRVFNGGDFRLVVDNATPDNAVGLMVLMVK